MKRERSVPLTLDDHLFAQTKSTSLETPNDGSCGTQRVRRGPGFGLFGDDEILGKLGHGGMGVVYRARQLKWNQVVALRMIRSGRQTTPAAVHQLQNKADALDQLDHPGIVPIYEVGNHLRQHFFTIKLFEGGDLARRLISFRENPYAAARLVAQLALEMICLKCLEKTPQNRYAKAIGLAEDLRQFAKHHQVVHRRMDFPETWSPECSDQSALTLLPTCQRVLATQSPSARPNLSESHDLSDYPANRSSVVPAGRFREGK